MRTTSIPMCLAAATLSLCACGTQDNTPKQHQPEQQLSINAPIEAFQTAYDSEDLIVYSGGEPTSPGALEHLAALGVKTVISVDATAPEADAIESLGMRSVHVPMGYSAVPIECQSAVAKAMRESEGAVFVHCHHGLHRGPTAAAAGLIALGHMTQGEAVGYMREAGTSMSYTKLYRGVADSTTLDDETIEQAELVRIAEVKELAAQMAEIDRVFENLELLAANNWQAPEDHPDLAAISEAGQLSDLFRAALTGRLESFDQRGNLPIEIIEQMNKRTEPYADAVIAAQALEDAVVANKADEATVLLKALGNRCSDCHAAHR